MRKVIGHCSGLALFAAICTLMCPLAWAQSNGLPFPTLPGGVPFFALGPQPDAVPVSSAGWQAVVGEYGPPLPGKQVKIIEDAVAELSRAAGTVAPRGGYRGTLLDTSVLNAFAIADGNVFITRQLLAHINDEDDLIGILGHEVGHVLGGHSRFDAATNTAARRGDRLLGVFLPGLATGAQVGGTFVLRGVDRAQEHSADVAGVKFLADLGRDPYAMGRSLALLEADAKLREKMFGASVPNALDYWLSSHPAFPERLGTVRLAASMAPRGKLGQHRSRAAFIRELDGMLFDDGPHQGIVNGHEFRHPLLKIAFDAPRSFHLLNGTSALMISGPDGTSAALKLVDGGGSPAERFQAAWTQSFPAEVPLPTPVIEDINAMASASGHVEVTGQGGMLRISLWLYAWSPTQSCIYAVVDPKGAHGREHAGAARSFRRLSDAEAAAVQVRRIKIVDVAPTETLASLAARMAYSDFREERFRLLNSLFDAAPLPKSGPVKLVVWAAQ